MSDFNVGDKVLLVKVENKYGTDQSDRYTLPMEVVISKVDNVYDFTVSDLKGNFVTHVDAKNLRPIENTTTKQTIIRIGDKKFAIQHTTNTKNKNISIQRTGRKIGAIKYAEVDTLISLLTDLKGEVDGEAA